MQTLDTPDAPRVKEIDTLLEGLLIIFYARTRALIKNKSINFL
jgi:hypothetical protein